MIIIDDQNFLSHGICPCLNNYLSKYITPLRSRQPILASGCCVLIFTKKLFPNDLDQHSLLSHSIELSVKDLFPGAEIQAPFGNRHDHFATHHLAFQMGIRIVFTGAVVPVVADRFMGSETFKPGFVILMQTTLIIVDKNRGRDVQGINQAQALLYSTFLQAGFHLWGEVDKSSPGGEVYKEFFTIRFHETPLD